MFSGSVSPKSSTGGFCPSCERPNSIGRYLSFWELALRLVLAYRTRCPPDFFRLSGIKTPPRLRTGPPHSMRPRMELAELKASKRKEAFAARKLADGQGHDEAANRILLEAIAHFPEAEVIAGYMPIRTELSPIATMTILHGQKKTICVPVIVGEAQPLKWAVWTPNVEMVEGAFKAQIPADPEYVTPDLVISPLVAFDRNGGRLGYGGGFYDRSLELLRSANAIPAIGFAYSAQELADLPLEPTDQPLSAMVTESSIMRF